MNKLNKLPIFVLQSSNNEFDQFSNELVEQYKNNPQVDIRQIRNLNEFSQSRLSPSDQPILIISDREANQMTPQLNMFRVSSQIKIKTVLYKAEGTPVPS